MVQCCFEFLNSLQDMNHGVRPEKSNEISHKDESSPSFSEKADTAWKEHIKRHNSLIVKMFHGQTVSTLTCQGCHKVIICAQLIVLKSHLLEDC